MLKNRYFVIIINDENKNKIYLRTKIDLYTEGISLYDGLIFQGYNYGNILLRVYKDYGKYEYNGISFSNGEVEEIFIDTDDMGISSSKNTGYTYSITEIINEDEIKKINSVINSNISEFEGEEKELFDTFRNKRQSFFKDFKEYLFSPLCEIGVGEYLPFEKSGFTMDEFVQMEEYVKSLSKPKENRQRGRDSNGNKIRKRNRR